MLKRLLFLILFCCSFFTSISQTTDLAIVVEAQDLNGITVSQVQIYQEFQYIVTIINSGNTVNNASFSLNLNEAVSVTSYSSQNNIGGATIANNFNLTSANVLSGTVAELPNNSSVEIKIIVNAPTIIGGIAIDATVFPPDDTQDINISNNQSIISIDVIDALIDFTVTHSQISPPEGTAINAWDDFITYEFIITNNSAVAYPLTAFSGILALNTPYDYGQPVVQFSSIACLEATNGATCPDVTGITSPPIAINSVQSVFSFNTSHVFSSGGSLRFQATYQHLQPNCGIESGQILVDSYISLELEHDNASSNDSNTVTSHLLTAELCPITDICIETFQTDPDPSVIIDWEQEVTFETTVCNNGPLDATILFFLQNLSSGVQWDIISISCIGTTGAINCTDITLTDNDQLWSSNEFTMPVGATITIQTVVIFYEPGCSTTTANTIVNVRSATNLLGSDIIDINVDNDTDNDYVTLPPTSICPSSDLQLTKTQINPILPEGSAEDNTTSWGPITYEITASNLGDEDTIIELSDYITLISSPTISAIPAIGTLISVDCIATTGTASCFTIEHANIGMPQDGLLDDGNFDVFWEILPEDNWALPAQSSVTFQVVVDWAPECSNLPTAVVNNVTIAHVEDVTDSNTSNNTSQVITYFAPCVDLIVQTFPEFTQVSINQSFDWVIDISNSATSSNAIDVSFEDLLDSVFTITGTPSCEVTSTTASCISNFTITNNFISGTIPSMAPGSTIRIRIPVTAPAFGGAFSNTAEATPSAFNNEELTPETNISISNVQVIAPTLIKSFDPELIFTGQQSILSFTVTNIASNTAQADISFIDNLPPGVLLSGNAFWVQDNGCTTTFIGVPGDDFIGVSNLIFPEGVSSCTFSVPVTSNTIGDYLNNDANFSDQHNIDTSQAEATLIVIEDTSNIDIEVLKTVVPEEVSVGEEVLFTITITNLGTTTATFIDVFESLPYGYLYLSSYVTFGTYDASTFLWSLMSLAPNQIETLTITAQVISPNDLLNTALLYSVNEIDRDPTNNEDSAVVIIDNCLNIPEGISPNNDGENDYLVIPCIENYENSVIKIFNRLGVQIYQNNHYNNQWDGKPNMGFPQTSTLLPVGTYYYILELKEHPNPIFGWVYLNY